MRECYECGTKTDMLSSRSRCVHCEHRRAILNEKENGRLREQLCSLERKYGLALENQVSKWISVDDQLPETYESYGFNGVDVEVSDIVATNQGAAVYLDGHWCEVGWDSHDLGKRIQGVTHWMPLPPLPQPPKEKGRE